MANTHQPRRGRINISSVVVLGLGRFGASLSEELTCHGVEVLGVDADPKVVQSCSDFLTDAAVGDTTDRETLIQLGVHEVDTVVLGIGSHLESSVLTASNLVDLGVKDIWAKADSDAHGKILTQVGADHVVRPERDTGRRIAHLLGGRFEEFAQFDEHYGMIKLAPPTILLGWPLDTDRLWERYKVRAISVRHPGDTWVPLSSGDYLSKDDQIIVAGDPEKLEMFANK